MPRTYNDMSGIVIASLQGDSSVVDGFAIELVAVIAFFERERHLRLTFKQEKPP